ncbi:hypothetical protein At15955_49180 (plasmid) [Agrobacterium tumefaciens]|nr:hypothetical protein At15955_49180 [Agrobacterium tumefaciens]CUX06222.1 hypothetical protein AGR1C_pAt40305 [Agrobacterium fabacearum TT111]AYM71206.1 hypothetical protein AtA6_49900 [Agrobacterium tumefaciens]NIB58645.1 transposase [Agrobacterium tumefaciens]NSZ25573.1 transposase [Agrobacterium tumefaciens]
MQFPLFTGRRSNQKPDTWENDYCESFNSHLRDELINGEIFCTQKETKIIIGNRLRHYDTVRLYSSLGYKPFASDATAWCGCRL